MSNIQGRFNQLLALGGVGTHLIMSTPGVQEKLARKNLKESASLDPELSAEAQAEQGEKQLKKAQEFAAKTGKSEDYKYASDYENYFNEEIVSEAAFNNMQQEQAAFESNRQRSDLKMNQKEALQERKSILLDKKGNNIIVKEDKK